MPGPLPWALLLHRVLLGYRALRGAVVRRLKVYELANPLGMLRREAGQLGAGQRMPHQVRPLDPEGVHEAAQIGHEGIQPVSALRHVRAAVSPPRHRQHAKVAGQLGGEAVVDACRVAQPGQQQDRLSAPAPVPVVQANPVDQYETVLDGGRGRR